MATAALLTACGTANDQAIYRNTQLVTNVPTAPGSLPAPTTNTLIMDAKQRAIISAPARRDDPQQVAIICTEPSPDAVSAISSALAGAGSFSIFGGNSDGSGSLGRAVSESVGKLGRAGTVQLLRDGLYRGCEAYMNGAMSREEYASLTRRYADLTVALMAIEQIGGVQGSSMSTISGGQTNASSHNDGEYHDKKTNKGPQEDDPSSAPAGETADEGAPDKDDEQATNESDSESHSRSTAGTGAGNNTGHAGTRRAMDAASAGHIYNIVDRYYRHSAGVYRTGDGNLLLDQSGNPVARGISDDAFRSRCMGYFDRPQETFGEISDGDYYIRKGMLLVACANEFPMFKTLLTANGGDGFVEIVGLELQNLLQASLMAETEFVKKSTPLKRKQQSR